MLVAEHARIAPIVSGILHQLGRSLEPGMRTRDIDAHARELLARANLDSKMLDFRGFPAALAVSIDDEVLHGIPGGRVIREGDLVKIQLGGRTAQGVADQGWTFGVGMLSEQKLSLYSFGTSALQSGLATIRAGSRVGDLGAAIQHAFEAPGCNVIRDFVGYTMGDKPMEEPQLPCYGKAGLGKRLEKGMILHVHAIGTAGAPEVEIKPDRWTAVTQDRAPSVLFTAMVRVTETGIEFLTPLLRES
jgi:methionyl aminopeptidase